MADRWRAIQNPWWADPATVAWRRDVVARIEALRAAEGPERCPTCGSSAHRPERRCSQCQVVKPLTQFNRDRRSPLGRVYQCKTCRQPQRRQRYLNEKRGKFQMVLWGKAS